jgi:glycerate kinase
VRVLVCPDSFKGSLSSVDAAEAVARGVELGAGGEGVDVVRIPLADGGEGTVDALVRATGGEVRHVRVRDPLMREVDSFFGLLGDGSTAVVEMAAASGLHLLSDDERNPLAASTFGTGELLVAAVGTGVSKLVVGIGGSATNDGGAGAMAALGARFLNSDGRDLPPGGAALAELDRIDMSGFRFPLDRVRVEVACDVTNPLTGPLGASAVFGPQKGATPEMVQQLDGALARFAEVVKRDLGKDVADMPGAGAAGGLGAGLAAFLNASLRSGIDMVLDAARFDEALADAGLVITGEGRIDEQTAYGKTIGGVLKRASKRGVPVVAVAGSVTGDLRPLYDAGLTAAFSLACSPMTADYAMKHADELLTALAANVIRLFGRSD